MKILISLSTGLTLLLSSCDNKIDASIPAALEANYTPKDYNTAVANGVSGIKVVQQFESTFPSAEHFITHYDAALGGSKWNSHVGLFGRYKLGLQFDIEFDQTRLIPHPISEPQFYLHEVGIIDKVPNGRHSIKYIGGGRRFGAEEWKILFDAKGNFDSIGYKLTEDRPVPGFEEIWQSA
jgi:hypothetical protein